MSGHRLRRDRTEGRRLHRLDRGLGLDRLDRLHRHGLLDLRRGGLLHRHDRLGRRRRGGRGVGHGGRGRSHRCDLEPAQLHADVTQLAAEFAQLVGEPQQRVCSSHATRVRPVRPNWIRTSTQHA